LQRQECPKIDFRGNFGAVRFSTFATVSAQADMPAGAADVRLREADLRRKDNTYMPTTAGLIRAGAIAKLACQFRPR
jgi:hypothetical protein